MALEAGTRLGHYEVVSSLGAGGMGEVYRAKDTKLGREVAVKLLLDEVSSDPERLARFEREARVLASLNHKNIASLHAFEREGDTGFLVMELVEGETLADRIRRGAIPVDEALPLFVQVAEGLEAAHEKGVIHRDLKPANIKISPDGVVKILDFGLAKATSPDLDPAAATLSNSPTLTLAATMRGQILGTAAYMAPEQAKGSPVDKRADLWAFGACLYEAITAKRAFDGNDATDILGSVLKLEPDWDALPAELPDALKRVLERCLAKDPRQRARDAGDLRLDLEAAPREKLSLSPETARPEHSLVRWIPWLVAAGAIAVVITLMASRDEAEPQPRPMTRTSIVLPLEAPLAPPSSFHLAIGRTSLALAPDGSFLVYVAWVDHAHHLYRRDMRSGEITPMQGTEGAQGPLFSPDSRWVGFFADGRLKKVLLDGGEPQVLATAVWGSGADWGSDGHIYFAPTEASRIYRVPENGGGAEPVTVLPKDTFMQTHPWLLPGTRDLILTSHSQRRRIVSRATVSSSEAPSLLLERGHGARVSPSGHLIFMDEGRLLAVAYDRADKSVAGTPIVILDDVRNDSMAGHMSATFSNSGTLIYPGGSDISRGRFVWADRQGNREPLNLPVASYQDSDVSPDGRTIAYTVPEGVESRIWVYDIERGTARPLTPGSGPFWSSVSDTLFYTSFTDAGPSVWRIGAEGSASPTEVLPAPAHLQTLGEVGIIYDVRQGDVSFAPWAEQLVAVDLDEARLILASEAQETFAALSPDERWLAYMSDESGTWEIYVTDFPEASIKRRVSTAGGEEPRWSPDGSEIIWRFGVDWFSVDFDDGEEMKLGAPMIILSGPFINVPGWSWDFSPDGRRFLVLENEEASEALTELAVIHDFFEEVERLVPTD